MIRQIRAILSPATFKRAMTVWVPKIIIHLKYRLTRTSETKSTILKNQSGLPKSRLT